MPKKVGTENWRKKRRQEYLEMKEFRYYIFCEGEQTEPLYFSGFKKLIEDNPIYRDMVLIQIEPCGAETMRVINLAERYIKDNHIEKGQIWCVYDKDSFPAENFNGVMNALSFGFSFTLPIILQITIEVNISAFLMRSIGNLE